ncbi:MAG: hypothetical protein WB699_00040 [Bacteroidota bacterium]
MKQNVRRFATLLGVVLISISVGCAQGMMRRMSVEARVDTLAKQLSLTDAQKAKVLDVFKGADAFRQKAFEDHQGDRDAIRAAMDSSRTETSAKMKTILTDDQYSQFQKIQAQMPMRRRGMNK